MKSIKTSPAGRAVSAALAVAAGALFVGSACACSVIMAGKNASTTGRVLVGHNEDDSGEQFVHHWIVPARDHAPGSFLPAEKTCAATVPQVPHTFSFFWTQVKNRRGGLSNADAFFNEHGVFVASDNAATEPFKDAWTTCSEGGIYYNLRRAIAERATSARMAVDIATNLITRWGYAAPRGRIYTVADKDEAWTIQVLNGRRFVARRCPDDSVVVVPNCLTIGRLEPRDVIAPCLAEEVAGKPDFDYARTFQGESRWRQPTDTLRWRHILRLATGVDVGDAFTYAVKPMHKISPEDIQAALSTHYEGTPDEIKPFRHGIDNKERYLPVCRLSTIESCICVFGATAAETELQLAPGSPCANAYRRFRPFSGGIPDELKTPGDPVENLVRHLQPMSKEEYLAEKRTRAAPVGTVVFRPGYAEIVIETNACDTIRVAAEEARDFMGRALGYDVPIVTVPTPSRTALFLGPNRWADAAGVTTNGLKRDGFRIRTAAKGVYVLGIDDQIVNAHRNRQRGGIWFQNFERATVFGVYDFLERFAGVRFYFPGELGTVVPQAAQIVVPPTDLVDAPVNTVRRYTIYENGCPYFEGENATELRHPMKTINWWRTRMETEYMPCCHGQNKFKYMDRFAKSHPEYFALLEDGRRHNSPKITYPGHPGQLCHTSAVWEEIYQDVKSYLSGEDASVRRIPVDSTLPGADGKVRYGWGVNCQRREIVDVMAQDGMIKCACERCKAEWAKAPEIGWASDLMWGNVARLANRLKAEGVKGRVSMMAYSKYRRVPDFPIPDNVEVMVAERGPWTENDPSERARELAEIRAWHDKIGRKVSLWTYLNKPSSLPDVPNCTPKAVARYFQQLAPLTYGVFMQDWSDHWLSQYLPRYVFGKVMWNPSVDVEALLDEHHRLMFGKAAPEMKRFFEEIERIYITRVAGKTIDTALGPQSEKPSPYELFVRIYSPETVDALEALFDAASAKVAAGSLEARRIALIRREMFDPLANRARAYVASIDVEKGLARDRASTKPNLVPVRIMPEGNGHLVGDGTRKMFGVSLRDADGKSSLKPGRRYRLSYCIKLDNLQPVKFNGGANVNVWAGMNFWLPSVPFSGTQDWTYQSFEFTAGEKTGEKGPSLLRLQIVNAKGEAWFDHVRIEELVCWGN